MIKETISWSINTLTQRQSFFNPPGQRRHGGSLEALLNKVLPSMGRSDIPSHLMSIIKHYGHGVLELPGNQRWDGLRLYYRSDKAELIIDYEAYKCDFSITKIKPDGGISIDSVSEMKMPPEWYEGNKVENKELQTGFSKVNEVLEINGGIRRGDLTAVPNKWLGESEINSEAVGYAALGETVESDETEQKLRQALRRARDRNNVRVGALGEPLGNMDEVVKARTELKEYLAKQANSALIVGGVEMNNVIVPGIKLHPMCADLDGDMTTGGELLRRCRWRTRNPSYQQFFELCLELYEPEFKPIAIQKTQYADYVLLVKLIRRDIYDSRVFLSPALLVKALYTWPGIVRADRKTAMCHINKTYKKIVNRRFRRLFTESIWEFKDMAANGALTDGSKREFIGNRPGMFRRTLTTEARLAATATRQLETGDDKE